jgi:hypothetical protein
MPHQNVSKDIGAGLVKLGELINTLQDKNGKYGQ